MASFAKRLLTWYDREQRDLPWRHSRDPWAIWVSEIMLQQTRVEVVSRTYPQFMARFATPSSFAKANDDALLAAWQGLGYYRRAKSLREGARQVVDVHGGQVPDTVVDLAALPGVGEYTAGAIASIAFGLAVPAVDGNVERVVARHRALRQNVKLRAMANKIREAVTGWMDPSRAGDFNQALMDLGATVCTPSSPQCEKCPVASDCQARIDDLTTQLPRLPSRRRAVDVVARAVLVPVTRGRILGCRIPEGEINEGQVDLPGEGLLVSMKTPAKLSSALERRFGVPFDVGPIITSIHHGITHHRVRLVVHQGHCARGPGPNLMAVRPDDARVPWTTAARKVFQQAALFLAARD